MFLVHDLEQIRFNVFIYISFYIVLGMHKKSMEAAECLQKEDETAENDRNDTHDISRTDGRNERTDSREKQEFCTESIAVLRAKAQEHNAKLTQNISDRDQRDTIQCSHSDTLLCRRLDESVYRNSFEETHSDMEIRVV